MLNPEKYRSEIKRLYAALNAENEQNDRIEDNDEWEKADAETAERYMPRIKELERSVSLIAESSQPRSTWFTAFCRSLVYGQHLSDKQMDVFAKYAKCNQHCRYKTPVNTFSAIVNGKCYSVSNIGRRLTITEITIL